MSVSLSSVRHPLLLCITLHKTVFNVCMDDVQIASGASLTKLGMVGSTGRGE